MPNKTRVTQNNTGMYTKESSQQTYYIRKMKKYNKILICEHNNPPILPVYFFMFVIYILQLFLGWYPITVVIYPLRSGSVSTSNQNNISNDYALSSFIFSDSAYGNKFKIYLHIPGSVR